MISPSANARGHSYHFSRSLLMLVFRGQDTINHPPIVVGCIYTIHRLAAKAVGKLRMASLLSPRQLGYGVSIGAQVAVHAARLYINNLGSNKAVLKFDFIMHYRDKMLNAVK